MHGTGGAAQPEGCGRAEGSWGASPSGRTGRASRRRCHLRLAMKGGRDFSSWRRRGDAGSSRANSHLLDPQELARTVPPPCLPKGLRGLWDRSHTRLRTPPHTGETLPVLASFLSRQAPRAPLSLLSQGMEGSGNLGGVRPLSREARPSEVMLGAHGAERAVKSRETTGPGEAGGPLGYRRPFYG